MVTSSGASPTGFAREPLQSEVEKNPTLPHELIAQILLRLPVRSLLRFKCVCTSWFFLISDTQFAESHFDLNAAPTHRLLSEIPLPPESASPVLTSQYGWPELYHVRILGGCLSLCYTCSGSDKAEIWVMKEYTVQSSWTKAFVMTSCDIPCKHFHPIHFIEGGGVVGTDGRGTLMKFNAEGKLLEHRKYREEYVEKYFAMYRESLLSFPGEQPFLRDFKEANEVEEATEDAAATEDVEATVDEEEEATEIEEATDDEEVESEEESNEDEEATEDEQEETTENDYI